METGAPTNGIIHPKSEIIPRTIPVVAAPFFVESLIFLN
jgi:hypothetical protein